MWNGGAAASPPRLLPGCSRNERAAGDEFLFGDAFRSGHAGSLRGVDSLFYYTRGWRRPKDGGWANCVGMDQIKSGAAAGPDDCLLPFHEVGVQPAHCIGLPGRRRWWPQPALSYSGRRCWSPCWFYLVEEQLLYRDRAGRARSRRRRIPPAKALFLPGGSTLAGLQTYHGSVRDRPEDSSVRYS